MFFYIVLIIIGLEIIVDFKKHSDKMECKKYCKNLQYIYSFLWLGLNHTPY